jgi:hypothetical protein
MRASISFGVALLMVSCGWAARLEAQVVILRQGAGKLVQVDNRKDALSTAEKKMRDSGAMGWDQLLISDIPGFGAAFCVSDQKRGIPFQIFISEGKSSSKEAIEASRARAAAHAERHGSTAYICGRWNNRNTHALDTTIRVHGG